MFREMPWGVFIEREASNDMKQQQRRNYVLRGTGESWSKTAIKKFAQDLGNSFGGGLISGTPLLCL